MRVLLAGRRPPCSRMDLELAHTHGPQRACVHRRDTLLPQEYEECLKQIEKVLEETDGLCEYAVYVKGLIMRQRGERL